MPSPESIYEAALALDRRHQARPVPASEYGLEPENETIYYTLNLPNKKQRQVTVNIATDFALNSKLPFEWKLEITFYDPDSHYLWLADGRFVRTVRKDFFDVGLSELEQIEKALARFN